jgi:3-dehydroquinate synthase
MPGFTAFVGAGASPYEVRTGSGLLPDAGAVLATRVTPGPALVVTDQNVEAHWLAPLMLSLSAAGFAPEAAVLRPGEETKSLSTVRGLYAALLGMGADRATPVVALGGGVVTDLAGFAAATFLRGVPWMAVPTTVLGQVDAAVGGKTGVNLPEGKNLVGAFHPPVAVLADIGTLDTLPDRHVRNGLAEVVKTGLGLSADLYAHTEAAAAALLARDSEALSVAVAGAVGEKAAVVTADEREAGPRRVLNLGHTAGHAIEAATGYGRVLHGEAVAIGLVAAARIAVARGMMPSAEVDRLQTILSALALPVSIDDLPDRPDRDAVARYLAVDKKRKNGRLALVLPERAGSAVVVEDGTAEEVLRSIPGF